MRLGLRLFRFQNGHFNLLHLVLVDERLAYLVDLVHVPAKLSKTRNLLLIRVNLVHEARILLEGLALLHVRVAANGSHELQIVLLFELIVHQLGHLLLQDLASLDLIEFDKRHVDVLVQVAGIRALLKERVQVMDLLDVPLPVLLLLQLLNLKLQLVLCELDVLL